MTPIGAGALFDRDAERRFNRIATERYRLIQARMEKKRIPLGFTAAEFRAWLLCALGGQPDGAVRCVYCGVTLDLSEVAIDHALPLIRGGSPGFDNMDLICQRCNDAKGALLPSEFMALLEFLEREIPLARTEVLKRLRQSVKLAAGMRHNMARIGELKKSGEWKKAGKKRMTKATK